MSRTVRPPTAVVVVQRLEVDGRVGSYAADSWLSFDEGGVGGRGIIGGGERGVPGWLRTGPTLEREMTGVAANGSEPCESGETGAVIDG
jgi:hypothetical protein